MEHNIPEHGSFHICQPNLTLDKDAVNMHVFPKYRTPDHWFPFCKMCIRLWVVLTPHLGVTKHVSGKV